ncbi:unnamed protein product [Symbiodinium microadriaticum]|nr:unnamed protein product [Symbiodinium microadriaticum]
MELRSLEFGPPAPRSPPSAKSMGVVEGTTQKLHDRLEDSLKAELQKVQREFQDLKHMQGQVAEDLGRVRDDVGQLKSAPREAEPPPQSPSKGADFDPAELEKRMDRRIGDLQEATRKLLDDRLDDVARKAAHAASEKLQAEKVSSPPAPSLVPSPDMGEMRKALEEFRQQMAVEVSKATVASVEDAIKKLPAQVPAAVEVAKAAPPPSPKSEPPSPKTAPAAPALNEVALVSPTPAKPSEPSEMSEPSEPQEPQEQAEVSRPEPLTLPETPPAGPAPAPELELEVPGWGALSSSYQQALKERLAQCQTEDERRRFMVSLATERTRPRKPRNTEPSNIELSWGELLSPKDADRAKLPSLTEEKVKPDKAEAEKVEQPPPVQSGGFQKKEPTEKRDTALTRRAFAGGLASFLQRCRPDLMVAPAASSASAPEEVPTKTATAAPATVAVPASTPATATPSMLTMAPASAPLALTSAATSKPGPSASSADPPLPLPPPADPPVPVAAKESAAIAQPTLQRAASASVDTASFVVPAGAAKPAQPAPSPSPQPPALPSLPGPPTPPKATAQAANPEPSPSPSPATSKTASNAPPAPKAPIAPAAPPAAPAPPATSTGASDPARTPAAPVPKPGQTVPKAPGAAAAPMPPTVTVPKPPVGGPPPEPPKLPSAAPAPKLPAQPAPSPAIPKPPADLAAKPLGAAPLPPAAAPKTPVPSASSTEAAADGPRPVLGSISERPTISPPAGAGRENVVPFTGIGGASSSLSTTEVPVSSQPVSDEVRPVGDLSFASVSDTGDATWVGPSFQPKGKPSAGNEVSTPLAETAQSSTVKPFSPLSETSVQSFDGQPEGRAESREIIRATGFRSSPPVADDIEEESM